MSRRNEVIETTFHTYRLGQVIGAGGAGTVFAATDESDKKWAIKLLDPSHITAERRKRFQNEILFSEHNRHRNIVRIMDHGITARPKGLAPFYVMPRYDGSLRAALRTLGDPAQRLRYFDQILSGVEAAHLVGVSHRDIKPENIFIELATGNVVVGDFGIAHFTDEELYTAVETRDDRRLANFAYAAPEQRIRGREVDARADIYALGLLLNELFTGTLPHGTGYVTIGRAFPDFGWLDPIVDTMLRQQPDQRPQSLDSVKQALIGHQQEYVIRQRLERLRHEVIPTAEITDPLAIAPLRVIDVDWRDGHFALTLNDTVNQLWIQAFQTFRWNRAMVPPRAWSISGNHASAPGPEHLAEQIIGEFREWMPLVTAQYRSLLEGRMRQEEARQRVEMQSEQEQLERRRRLRGLL